MKFSVGTGKLPYGCELKEAPFLNVFSLIYLPDFLRTIA